MAGAMLHQQSKDVLKEKLCPDQWQKNIPQMKPRSSNCHKTGCSLHRSSAAVPGASSRQQAGSFHRSNALDFGAFCEGALVTSLCTERVRKRRKEQGGWCGNNEVRHNAARSRCCPYLLEARALVRVPRGCPSFRSCNVRGQSFTCCRQQRSAGCGNGGVQKGTFWSRPVSV